MNSEENKNMFWPAAMGAGTGEEQDGQVPTLEKIRVDMAHPGNFNRGLKTSWQ